MSSDELVGEGEEGRDGFSEGAREGLQGREVAVICVVVEIYSWSGRH
jgi:hypothetical protein